MKTKTNKEATRTAVEIEQQLSETDRQVVETVDKLTLLTGEQLRRLFFEGESNGRTESQRARRALLRLARLDLLARLERRIGGKKFGSDTFCYRLGSQGERLVRWWQEGIDAPGRLRPEPGERFLRHRLAVSGVYIRLVEAARQQRDDALEVLEFDGEPDCWRPFDNGLGGRQRVLKPDAFFKLGVGENEHWWFCEVDLGTVSRKARETQAGAYRSYWRSGAAGNIMPRVLWLTTNELVSDRVQAAIDPPGNSSLFVIGTIEYVVAAATARMEGS